MSASAEAPQVSRPGDLVATASDNRRRCRWEETARLATALPVELTREWLAPADEIAFSLGRLRRTDDAARLLERAFALEPTARRASALAYLYYEALMPTRVRQPEAGAPEGRRGPRRRDGHARGHAGAPRPARDREADRAAFTRWITEALRLQPESIKDLYRLGVFEAQIMTQHDVAALRAFNRAIDVYRALPAAARAARPDLHKPYIKCLYAGARSALRLGRVLDARRLCFACIREDSDSNHIEPVFRYFLAGRICAAQGQADHAERAFRLALDAAGPPERAYVHTALAGLALGAGRLDDAAAWIERHVQPHRRSAAAWRLLGDVRRARAQHQEALVAYENALRHDRAGRHLTLVRVGDVHRAAGRMDQAERAYEQAATFRRLTYLSEDAAALDGLLAVATARGDTARIETLRGLLASLPPRRGEGRTR